MRNSHIKNCSFFVTIMLLSACSSSSGDWPSLAEPLPDTSSRERVIERAEPVNTSRPVENSPVTVSTAIKLYDATEAKLRDIRSDYLAAKARINSADAETKMIEWRDAQLKLTRYSKTLSRLDAIIDASSLQEKSIWRKAQTTKQELDAFVVAERRELAAMQPGPLFQ